MLPEVLHVHTLNKTNMAKRVNSTPDLNNSANIHKVTLADTKMYAKSRCMKHRACKVHKR